jgi:hypothetical protein
MDIDQRGSGAPMSYTNSSYCFDRWTLEANESSISYRAHVQRVDATAEGAQFAMKITPSGTGAG